MFFQDLLSKLVASSGQWSGDEAVTPHRSRKPSRRHASNGARPAASATPTIKGERFYRDKLAMLLNGRVDIAIPTGQIDILTATEVIEVKSVDQWKDALDQIRIYGQHYPLHRKRIHLFGHMSPKKLLHIQQHCFRDGVVVTWEDE